MLANISEFFPVPKKAYNQAMPWILFLLATSCFVGCSVSDQAYRIEPGKDLIVLTRKSPSTYYFNQNDEVGFDYFLVKKFAETEGMNLKIRATSSFIELFRMLENGEAHFAAAGLSQTDSRDNRFLASKSYHEQRALIIYKSGNKKPRRPEALIGRDLIVMSGSDHSDHLVDLQKKTFRDHLAGGCHRRFA